VSQRGIKVSGWGSDTLLVKKHCAHSIRASQFATSKRFTRRTHAFDPGDEFTAARKTIAIHTERLSMREVEHKWANPNEDIMRRIFRLWRMSRNDLRLVWLALRHPNRPTWLLPATLALAFFALEPFNSQYRYWEWLTIFFCCRCSYMPSRKLRCTQRRYRQLRGRAMIAWYRCNKIPRSSAGIRA
jgi:hypothetical protein